MTDGNFLEVGRGLFFLLGAAIVLILVAVGVRRLIRRSSSKALPTWLGRLLTVGLVLFGILLLTLTLNIDPTIRDQLIGLLGVAITGIIAVSSTTFVTNAMAGLMLRALRNFKPGDWIVVADQFGRVSEQGLLHTEIQTEDRDLTTIPNLFMVTQPVKVVRSSGTIVSAEVSLGYDAPRSQVKELLTEAASDCGLTEPFVQVTTLGDFSVGYRIGGFLEEVSTLVGTRSKLRTAVLDALHGAGIEIVSPAFMNQRQVEGPVIPRHERAKIEVPHEAPESLVFDKATKASQAVMIEEMLSERKERLAAGKKQSPDDEGNLDELATDLLQAEIEALEELLSAITEDPSD